MSDLETDPNVAAGHGRRLRELIVGVAIAATLGTTIAGVSFVGHLAGKGSASTSAVALATSTPIPTATATADTTPSPVDRSPDPAAEAGTTLPAATSVSRPESTSTPGLPHLPTVPTSPPSAAVPSPTAVPTPPPLLPGETRMLADHRKFTLTTLKDGRVLAVGGYGAAALCELYDPQTGRWAATGSLAVARSGQTATLLDDGTVLVTGGNIGTASAELYDPATGTWSAVGPMISPRYDHVATLLDDGRVLVVGGDDGSHILASAELYNPGTRTFTPAHPMHYSRYGASATTLPDGTVMVTGGFGFGQPPYAWLTSTELYDPTTDTWTDSAPMPFGRYHHTATLVPQTGEVVVTGGVFDCCYTIGTTVAYTIATHRWSTVGSLNESRWGDTATALPDGRILVTGGVTMNGGTTTPRPEYGPYASTEIYDPATGQWSFGPNLAEGRYFQAAAMLHDGRVLVAGGGSASSEILSP